MTNTPPPRDASGPRKPDRPLSLKPLLLLAVIGLLSAAGVLLYDHYGRVEIDPLAPDENLDMLEVPAFTMTAQNGETFTRDDLLGNITVLDFFFTNCPAICPALSRAMKQIQDAVGDRGVRLVSISVDPAHDTIDVLRAHAIEVGADPGVWSFLRPENFEQVQRMSEESLKLGLSLDNERPIKVASGGEMPWINHAGKLVLLDADARVIGLYSGLDERDVVTLIERIGAATEPE